MITREEFDALCNIQYDVIVSTAPFRERLAIEEKRRSWLDIQWRIFQAVGGDWPSMFSWAGHIDNALASFYAKDVLACESMADFRTLVRRTFVEFWKITLSDDDHETLDLVGRHSQRAAQAVSAHVRELFGRSSRSGVRT